jgi:hypothetical protein
VSHPSHPHELRARPQPTQVPPPHAAAQAVAEAREAALMSQVAAEALLELERLRATPADLIAVTLSSTQLSDMPPHRGRSIGILNPTTARIYIGVGGASANAGGKSPSCPPKTFLVLPVAVNQPELGVDPADVAAGAVTFYVLYYPTPQPALLGGLP